MNDNPFSNDNAQFVLSYELLCFLRWLVYNDSDKLKKLITKALASGLKDDIDRIRGQKINDQMNEEVQHSILDFFNLLEMLLNESVNEQTVQRALSKNLMPAIDQIDSSICDDEVVRSSVEKVTTKIEHNPKANEQAKELLFKEVLKRWKPHNKNILN
jgi:uncharacterized membrane-anchored protein YjiN (DUF445 family)